MDDGLRRAKVSALVDDYVQLGAAARPALREFLAGVEPDLRDEVASRCEDAVFIDGFFASLPPLRLLPTLPATIGGCRLGDLLGEGAMGKVYRGRQLGLDRDVAVKLVPIAADGDGFLDRLREESRVLAALDHPGIVRVLACGEEAWFRYVVMELVHGQSLAEALPRLRCRDGGSDPRCFDRAARILAELLEALAYAHRQGIVHRDLKPSNVMLDRDGHPRLVDFGLAKGDSSPQRTRPGQLLGTPAYLSPELVGKAASEPVANDVWAAGVILFQLLTGRLPYAAASTGEVLDKLLRPVVLDPRRHVREVPAPLAAICTRALHPEPTLRYATAAAFAQDLRRFLAGEVPEAARHAIRLQVQAHFARHRRAYRYAAVLAAVGVVAWYGAKAHATNVHNDELLARLPAIERIANVEDDALRGGAQLARQLLAAGTLGADRRAQVQRTLAAIEAEARRRHDAAATEIRLGAGSPRGTPVIDYQGPSPARQARGVRAAAEAVAIVPELATPEALVEASWPALRIAAPRGFEQARVTIDAVDPVTGRRFHTAATAPCELSLPPGSYRIVVGDEAAFAECSRTFVAPGVHSLEPVLVPTMAARSGMVFVPAGRATVGQAEPAVVYGAREVEHAGFYIDPTEVTCAEYHAWCVARGVPFPRTWQGAYDPAWADLPVTGVGPLQALAYAEDHGKRLPTWIEWQIAARGPNGDPFPWGKQAAPLADLPTIGHGAGVPWHAGVRAVGTTPIDRSPHGLSDVLGNVEEWLDNPYVAVLDGVPFPFVPWRLVGGAGWQSSRDARVTNLAVHGPAPPESQQCGFRCAKSILP